MRPLRGATKTIFLKARLGQGQPLGLVRGILLFLRLGLLKLYVSSRILQLFLSDFLGNVWAREAG